MHAHVAPASNHSLRFSLFGDTPPVGMMLVHGCGPLMFFMNFAPKLSPGKSLTISQPISSACAISVNEPHPGDHNTLRLLQTIAMSLRNTGVTIKLAPNAMYKEADAASVMEPTPMTI